MGAIGCTCSRVNGIDGRGAGTFDAHFTILINGSHVGVVAAVGNRQPALIGQRRKRRGVIAKINLRTCGRPTYLRYVAAGTTHRHISNHRVHLTICSVEIQRFNSVSLLG